MDGGMPYEKARESRNDNDLQKARDADLLATIIHNDVSSNAFNHLGAGMTKEELIYEMLHWPNMLYT